VLFDVPEAGTVAVSLPVVEQVSLLAGGSRGFDRTPPRCSAACVETPGVHG
jgi:hypothetical protein